MKCEYCGTQNPSDAKECRGCGRSREEMDFLAQALEEVKDGVGEYD